MKKPLPHPQSRACIEIPYFPLQLVLHKKPLWKKSPVIILRHDKPSSPILWANREAQKRQIKPGMTYSTALSIDHKVHATTVSLDEINTYIHKIVELLRKYSDRIEPNIETPGVFWLATAGLGALHPCLKTWGNDIITSLRDRDLEANIAVGFTRFATYAITQALRPGILLLKNPKHEQELLRRISVEHLQLSFRLTQTLRRLGIRTIGHFLDLPSDEIRPRLGADAFKLYRWAKGELDAPIQSLPEVITVSRTIDFDFPETSLQRLIFLMKKPLYELLKTLESEYQKLESLKIFIVFESKETLETKVCPAEPTLDENQIIELVRLHFDTLQYSSGIHKVILSVELQPSIPEQLNLFSQHTQRDLKAGNRALARIRAEWGEKAVVKAVLREGHLPEAQFKWEPLRELQAPHVSETSEIIEPPLMRRLFLKPQCIGDRVHTTRDDNWLLHRNVNGVIIRLDGPYILKGGWWLKPIHREYNFATTQTGRLLWVYYDRKRRQWFLHGEVE